ncbi:hypothetical protein EDD85DRAFT_346767 [Armillaria nabsnona]|nr:hypothetical protein EDD85DRAFT_346767 [Armillaria nabsnona]
MTILHFRYLLLSMVQTRLGAAQGNDESSNESSNRTTWDIIWSCLATIFACTWLAVHPNVPNRYMREKGQLFLGLHRVKHMLLAIICPEAIIMWAFRQRLVASVLSKHLELSMTHGFFVSMGGFVGKDDRPILPSDLFDLSSREPRAWCYWNSRAPSLRSGLDIPILSITKEDLMDKSKGDALSKSISLLQTTWFVVQYFSRITLSLPTTPLETATLAFALLNFCNYILWWHKPLNVQYPLNFPDIDNVDLGRSRLSNSTQASIPRHEESESSISLVQLPTNNVLEHGNLVKSAAKSKSNASACNSTTGGLTTNRSHVPISPSSTSTSKHQLSVDYVKNHASESVCCHECLECDISNHVAVSINDWRFFYDDPGSIIKESSRCRGSDVWSVFQASVDSVDILPTVATGGTPVTNSGKPRRRYRLWFHEMLVILIPSLCVRVWRWYHLILGGIIHGAGDYSANATLPMLWAGQPRNLSQMGCSAFFGGCFGALFGGVHCIGLSSSGFFASSLEHLLWKISSLSIALIPVILAFSLLALLVPTYLLTYLKLGGIVFRFARYSPPVLIFIYICARVYILVDMFASLRSLPPGVLKEINWTRYIPHI